MRQHQYGVLVCTAKKPFFFNVFAILPNAYIDDDGDELTAFSYARRVEQLLCRLQWLRISGQQRLVDLGDVGNHQHGVHPPL